MNTFRRFAIALPLVFSALADDYPRQPGIDAQHYLFRVRLADDSDSISGEATIDLRFVQPGLTKVALDLAVVRAGKGMTVTDATSSGEPVPYTHAADRLTMTLASV
jgi:hypothetical protein